MFRVVACIATEHDLRLVAIAALICVLSVAVSFVLLTPANGNLAQHRKAAAAAALGGGAWATHFVAMLAYKPGLPTAFDPSLTLGSAGVAMLAVLAALNIWGRARHNAGRAFAGGFAGLGIGAMHYMGMAAVRLPGRLEYDWTLVAVSILLGAGAMASAFAHWHGDGDHGRRARAGLGVVVGIVLLHFTGMGSVSIVPESGTAIVASIGFDHERLAALVAAGAGLTLALSAAALWAEARARARTLATEALRLRDLADAGLDGLVLCDSDGSAVEVNSRFAAWVGLDRDVLLGRDVRALIRMEPSEAGVLGLTRGEPHRATLLGACGEVPVEVVVGEMNTAEGKRTVIAVHDLREKLRAEARFEAALDNMPHGLCMFDAEERLLVANLRYVEMYAMPQELTRPGTPLRHVLAHHVKVGACPEGLEVRVAAHLSSSDEGGAQYELRELKDGRTIAVSRRRTVGNGWVSIHEDVTERRRVEEQMSYIATHDALTGLPNRVLFHKKLDEALAQAQRGHSFAVLCLDLDRFKDVNDTLGHAMGDALLREAAGRLRAELRETDTLARLGGDEFAVIQTDADQPNDATILAKRLVEVLSVPFEIDGHQLAIGTSVGVALAPTDGLDPERLIKGADLALYRAKAEGRGRWRFFEPEMDARMQARRVLELELRRALALGEFELFYQPIMNVASRRVGGFEALVRWRHPERGLVVPDAFIPLAEEIGLIIPLGEWVLARACIEAVNWPGAPKVAVNLSPAQFASRGLVDAVAVALEQSGLAPGRLELEITETVMLQNTEATLATLHRLKELGVRIAMDDFGTGYSSLSYLQRFPFDKVKIDRSFTSGLGASRESEAIVRAVTDLCVGLDMTTTAEGVETEAQLHALQLRGCQEAQGYLFSKPLPASDIIELISRLECEAAEIETSNCGLV